MKRENIDILKDEVVIPEVVTNAAEDAFAKILCDTARAEQNSTEVALMKKPGTGLKKRWIAIAIVAVLAVGTLTVGAATNFQWFHLMTEELKISENEKAMIEKYNMGANIAQSVTDNGITITLEEYICDRRAAYVIYSIEGIDAPKEGQWLVLGGEGSHAGNTVNRSGKYLGKDTETGKLLYMESILTSSNGRMDSGYMFANFTSVEIGEEQSLETVWSKEGQWDFKVKLEENTSVREYQAADITIGNDDILLKSVTVSPVSIEYVTAYSKEYYDKACADEENRNSYRADCYGYKMKDGTIEEISGGGSSGGMGLTVTATFHYAHIIDIDQAESLLFRGDAFNSDDGITSEDFIEIPLADLQEVQQ